MCTAIEDAVCTGCKNNETYTLKDPNEDECHTCVVCQRRPPQVALHPSARSIDDAHGVCCDCLQNLVMSGSTTEITCPSCRQKIPATDLMRITQMCNLDLLKRQSAPLPSLAMRQRAVRQPVRPYPSVRQSDVDAQQTNVPVSADPLPLPPVNGPSSRIHQPENTDILGPYVPPDRPRIGRTRGSRHDGFPTPQAHFRA